MKRRIWWIAAAVLLVVIALGVLGFQCAKEFESLTKTGKTDAITALRSLEANQAEDALGAFRKSEDEFRRARDLLGPDWLQGLPWLGKQRGAAHDLLTIGIEGSSAGANIVEMVNQVTVMPESMTRDEWLSQLMKSARPHLDDALVSLVAVAQRYDVLTADGLVPPLAQAVTEVKDAVAPMQVILKRSQSMLNLERYLLGSQHRFLVVTQNSAELRPAGGFMGTYGLIEIGPDGFHPAKYTDMFTLPKDTLNLPIPAGGQVNYRHFWFRNSNWWMDFPTSARQMMVFWENMNQPAVDGIVAVDIPAIQDLLRVLGPIKVPESTEPLTAENVMEQLTYVVEYTRSGGSTHGKKAALLSLANALGEVIANVDPAQVRPTLESLANSANQKHLQVYLTEPAAQSDMVEVGWSGALDAPAGTTDLLAVSNGVIKPSKANIGVSKSLDYEVVLAADGSAETVLRLGYRKSPKLLLGMPQQWLANYVRAHRADGTMLSPGQDPKAAEPLDDATGLPTFGHYFRLDPGKSTNVMMDFKVPQAMRQGAADDPLGTVTGGAAEDVWHYRLLLAKQADLVETSAEVTVQVPEGWGVARSAATWRVSGTPITTSATNTEVSVRTALKEDLILDVTLTRA